MSERPPAPDRPLAPEYERSIGRRPGTPTMGDRSRGDQLGERAFVAFIVIAVVAASAAGLFAFVDLVRIALREVGLELFVLALAVIAVVLAAAWYVAGLLQRSEWFS